MNELGNRLKDSRVLSKDKWKEGEIEREGDGTGIAETIINSQFSVSRFPKLEREGDVPGDTSCRLFRARKRRGRDEREREGGDRRMCGGCKCAREMRSLRETLE